MATTQQHKINTYAAELTRIAHAAIHNEEALKDVSRCTALYKGSIVTKQHLDKALKWFDADKNMKLKLIR